MAIFATGRLSRAFGILVLLAPLAFGSGRGEQKTEVRSEAAWTTMIASAPAPLATLWPEPDRIVRLSQIGRGKGIVFSPDFSAPGNREFYERLGFVYFEDANWERILGQIVFYNSSHPDRPIEVLILETHGTNGEGLKVQVGRGRRDRRSYISAGALQERLESTGVRACVLAACNSGRLLRPRIYKRLNRYSKDPLFLPATLGVLNSSLDYDPARSSVLLLRRADSHIENTTVGNATELSAHARAMLGYRSAGAQDITNHNGAPGSTDFVVSDLLIQMLVRDPTLRVSASGHVTKAVHRRPNDAQSEALYRKFLNLVHQVAEREYLAWRTAGDLLR